MRRFLKIFLISLSSLIGVIGIILGIMFISGYFNEDPVLPQSIEFSQDAYFVDDNFELTITTTTEEVNQLNVTLYFDNEIVLEGDKVTDPNRVITVPRNVEIGKPFTVELNQSIQNLNGENIKWINGGIASLKAKCQNTLAQDAKADIYVDVPVKEIEVKTMIGLEDLNQTNVFNVGSDFWVQANFYPEKSKFKYSQDGSDNKAKVYKSVFFDANANELLEKEDALFAQKYNALIANNNAQIKVQAFSKSTDEISALETVSVYEDESRAKEELLNILQTAIDSEKGCETVKSVMVQELVVGNYTIDTSNTIPSVFNSKVTIFANKENLLAGEFSFNAQIFANDNVTPLQSQIEKLAIGVYYQNGTQMMPATPDMFEIEGGNSFEKKIFDADFVLYSPKTFESNINLSHWTLSVLKENLDLKVFVVLLDEENNIREVSFHEGLPKYNLSVDSTSVISNQVRWDESADEERVIYLYGSNSFTQVDLKNLKAVVPSENTYKEVRYFAYIENSSAEKLVLSDYIVTDSKEYTPQHTGLNFSIYELPDGLIIPKGEKEFPLTANIRVLFATIKTKSNGAVDYVDDNGQKLYRFDQISMISANGYVQALKFKIVRSLSSFDAVIKLDPINEEKFNISQNAVSFVHGTNNAFSVDISVPVSDALTLQNEFNNEKINIIFTDTNNQPLNLFAYPKYATVTTDENFATLSVPVSISQMIYESNDLGYRNFKVRVEYSRQMQDSIVQDVLFVINQDQTLEPAIFEVYDGKISTLTFEEALCDSTTTNPIGVLTNLVAEGEAKDGIFTASSESKLSMMHNGFDLVEHFEDGSVKVIAKDKYGKIIKDTSLYELVSSNSSIVSIDKATHAINFVKQSEEVVQISVESAHGIGGRKIVGSSMFLKIQTQGEVADVVINTTGELGNENIVFGGRFVGPDEENLFDENQNVQSFASSTIKNINVVGKSGSSINFTSTNIPFLKVNYASKEGDKYKIYDIKNLLRFTCEEEGKFTDFLTFNKDENGNISSISFVKDFGRETSINILVNSTVGFNAVLNITIMPVVEISMDESVFEAGMGSLIDGKNYVGVYAQKQYEVVLYSNVEPDFSTEVVPTLTGANDFTDSLSNVSKKPLSEFFEFDNDTGKYVYRFNVTFNDVAGNSYKEYLLCFASGANGVKLDFDFAMSLYVRVLPNFKAVINEKLDENKVSETELDIKTSQSEISKLLSSSHLENSLFVYERLKEGSNASFNGSFDCFISNENGEMKNDEYFVVKDGVLSLRNGKTLSGTQSVFLAVVHVVDGDSNLLEVFKVNVTCDINEKTDTQFVKYNGKTHLQLLAGKTYSYQELCEFFDSNAEIDVVFDSKYVANKANFTINQTGVKETSSIEINETTIILSNHLEIRLRINGVGEVVYPVLIMPILAPFVGYKNIMIDADVEDLANIMNTTFLFNNNVYDEIEDGKTYDISDLVSTENKLIIADYLDNEKYNITLSLLNSDGSSSLVSFASVEGQKLITKFVGQDEFVILVVNINGFEFYYRLKVKSSLNFNAFYPYDDNAEYHIFRSNETSFTIENFTKDFTEEIPTKYFGETKVKNRFMMFDKQNNIFEGEGTQIKSIDVKQIKIGYFDDIKNNPSAGLEIPQENFANYVSVSNNFNITLQNKGNYVVWLNVKTENNATCEYVIVVEQSNRVYELVEVDENNPEDLFNATKVSGEISLETLSSLGSTGEDAESLKNWRLRQSTGASYINATENLKYYVAYTDKIVVEDKVIKYQYSNNDINAKLIAYHKYGVVDVIDIKLSSTIRVTDNNGQEITQPISVVSGSVFNLENEIKFAIKNGDSLTPINDDIKLEKIKFNQSANIPEFIANQFDIGENGWFNLQNNEKLLIRPVTEQKEMSCEFVAKIDGEEYKFSCDFVVLPTMQSYYSDRQNPLKSDLSVVATKNHDIDVNKLFENNSDVEFTVDAETDKLTYKISGFDGEQYVLACNILSGGNVCLFNSIYSNKLTFNTLSTANTQTVLIEFVVRFGSGDDFSEISRSYYSFDIESEVDVLFNYPIPTNTMLDFESLYVSNGLNLDANAEYQTNKRVVIAPKEGNSSLVKSTKVKVTVKEGQINISANDPDENGLYDFATSFSFDFDELSNSYAVVDFEIYVNEISRGTYTAKIYKNITDLYSIVINNINETENGKEKFVVLEDRKDIFNGVQAFRFKVNNLQSILSNQTKISVYAGENETDFITSFVLMPSDRGMLKTVKLDINSQDSEKLSLVESLNYSNIRFKINDGEQFFNLSQMTHSENPYFALNIDGSVDFELVNRIAVKYLGYTITNPDFLEYIRVEQTGASVISQTTLSSFRVSYQGLGEYVFEIDDYVVSIYYGNDISLGTYTYSLHSNIFMTHDPETDEPLEIVVGGEIKKLLTQYGLKRHDGKDLVVYNNDTAIDIYNLIESGVVKLDLWLPRSTNNPDTDENAVKISEFYKIIGTDEEYSISGKINTPIEKTDIVNENRNIYDFEIKSFGAPNAGIYGNIILEAVIATDFKENPVYEHCEDDILGNNQEENFNNNVIRFLFKLPVKVLPCWQVELVNSDASQNSEQNPNVIKFNSTEDITLVLYDEQNLENTKIFVSGKSAGISAFNISVSDESIAQVDTTNGVKIKLLNQDFATKELTVKFVDDYGFEFNYHVKLVPPTTYSIGEIGNDGTIFEENTFTLDRTLTGFDHLVEILGENGEELENITVTKWELLDEDKNLIKNAFSVVDNKVTLNVLNPELFDGNGMLKAYIQLELTKNNESYNIQKLVQIHKKYDISAVNNQFVSDGQEFDLSKVIATKNNKSDGKTKTLKVYNDTFVIVGSAENNQTNISFEVVKNQKTSKTIIVEFGALKSSNYIKLSSLFEEKTLPTDVFEIKLSANYENITFLKYVFPNKTEKVFENVEVLNSNSSTSEFSISQLSEKDIVSIYSEKDFNKSQAVDSYTVYYKTESKSYIVEMDGYYNFVEVNFKVTPQIEYSLQIDGDNTIYSYMKSGAKYTAEFNSWASGVKVSVDGQERNLVDFGDKLKIESISGNLTINGTEITAEINEAQVTYIKIALMVQSSQDENVYLKFGELGLKFETSDMYSLNFVGQSNGLTTIISSEDESTIYTRYIKPADDVTEINVTPTSLFDMDINVGSTSFVFGNTIYLKEDGNYKVQLFDQKDKYSFFETIVSAKKLESPVIVNGGTNEDLIIEIEEGEKTYTLSTTCSKFSVLSLGDISGSLELISSDPEDIKTWGDINDSYSSLIIKTNGAFIANATIDIKNAVNKYGIAFYDGTEGLKPVKENSFISYGYEVVLRKAEALEDIELNSQENTSYQVSLIDGDGSSFTTIIKDGFEEDENKGIIKKDELVSPNAEFKVTARYVVKTTSNEISQTKMFTSDSSNKVLISLGHLNESDEFAIDMYLLKQIGETYSAPNYEYFAYYNEQCGENQKAVWIKNLIYDSENSKANYENAVVEDGKITGVKISGNKTIIENQEGFKYTYLEDNTAISIPTDDFKAIIVSLNSGRLAWHEYKGKSLACGKVFYTSTVNQTTTNESTISGGNISVKNGEVITNIWDGVMNVSLSDEELSGATKLTYTSSDGKEVTIAYFNNLKEQEDFFIDGKLLVGKIELEETCSKTLDFVLSSAIEEKYLSSFFTTDYYKQSLQYDIKSNDEIIGYFYSTSKTLSGIEKIDMFKVFGDYVNTNTKYCTIVPTGSPVNYSKYTADAGTYKIIYKDLATGKMTYQVAEFEDGEDKTYNIFEITKQSALVGLKIEKLEGDYKLSTDEKNEYRTFEVKQGFYAFSYTDVITGETVYKVKEFTSDGNVNLFTLLDETVLLNLVIFDDGIIPYEIAISDSIEDHYHDQNTLYFAISDGKKDTYYMADISKISDGFGKLEFFIDEIIGLFGTDYKFDSLVLEVVELNEDTTDYEGGISFKINIIE